jgi:hypothetical protein
VTGSIAIAVEVADVPTAITKIKSQIAPVFSELTKIPVPSISPQFASIRSNVSGI